jgi:hypothetical protein
VEILNKSGDVCSDGIFSDIEIDDLALADVIINDSDKEKETCKTCVWETMDDYSGNEEFFL